MVFDDKVSNIHYIRIEPHQNTRLHLGVDSLEARLRSSFNPIAHKYSDNKLQFNEIQTGQRVVDILNLALENETIQPEEGYHIFMGTKENKEWTFAFGPAG